MTIEEFKNGTIKEKITGILYFTLGIIIFPFYALYYGVRKLIRKVKNERTNKNSN